MNALIAAIRSQPWAILPEYLAAIETVALRLDNGAALATVAEDGHRERMDAFRASGMQRVPSTRAAVFAGPEGVALLPVFGPIFPRANMMTEMSGAASAELVGADLAALDANRDVRRIMLVLDSPGGAVAGIARLAAQIGSTRTPVHAHVEGVSASAAYWLTAQAREISIDPTGAVGSIGVIYSSSVQEGPDASGRRTVEVVSTNAPDKRGDLRTEEGAASVRAMIDEMEAVFIADVARGRGVGEEVVKREFGAGGMKAGRAAKAAGMVDRVEFRAAAIDRLAKQLAPAAPKRTVAEASQAVALLRASLN